jgi:hypothetical protein
VPIQTNFSLVRLEDGVLAVQMVPSTAIGGWQIEWNLVKRLGSTTPIATRSVASGYNGASGITVTDSGQGMFNITINSVDTSGLNPGNYANGADRLSSGRRSALTQGFLTLLPSTMG